METKTRNGFVVISGTPYRRSDFVARRTTSVKDWALFGLIMLGVVASLALAAACVGLLVWGTVEMIGAIGRQIGTWR